MKILFLSNYYPPHILGGYEQWCCEVAEELASRGHELFVLTSRPPYRPSQIEQNGVQVYRDLHLEVDSGVFGTAVKLLRDRNQLEESNLEYVRKVVSDAKPDVALVWGSWNIPRSVPAYLEELMAGHLGYYFCDYWPALPSAYLQQLKNPSRHRFSRIPKKILVPLLIKGLEREKPVQLGLENPICVSRALRERLVRFGFRIANAQVIYVGTRPVDFAEAQTGTYQASDGLKLVYVGRLTPDKGVHTAIQALAQIPRNTAETIILDIFGKGDWSYERKIRSLVREYGLANRISFRGTIPREKLPDVLSHYDALVLPSEWEEPFARIVLEAMAAGLIVIGSNIGGTTEVIMDGQTGLLFPAGDANALSGQILRLRDDRHLREKLSHAGRVLIANRFTLGQMVDKLEGVLHKIAR